MKGDRDRTLLHLSLWWLSFCLLAVASSRCQNEPVPGDKVSELPQRVSLAIPLLTGS